MKYLLFSLLLVSQYATAQIFPTTCPAGQAVECTYTFKYDAAGNRNERRAACMCVILLAAPPNTPPTARLRNPNTEESDTPSAASDKT